MNPNLFAKNLRTVRSGRGLSQTDVAKKLFVTPQTVSKWESGHAFPDVENLCNLASALNTTPDRLLGIGTGEEKFFIAIDAGGTKCDTVLFRENGTVLDRKRFPGANPNVCGRDRSVEILTEAIRTTGADRILSGIFAGIAGATAADNKEKMTATLKRNFPGIPLSIDTDIENVISCVRGVEKCVAAISGTGTSVFAKTEKGLTRLGGYGYLFDGAGSGYDIGRDALLATFEADDGLRPDSPMTRLVRQKLGGRPWDKLTDLYNGGKDTVASFAMTVFEASRIGDEGAREILNRNFSRIIRLIRHAKEHFDCGTDVICAGSVTRAPEFREELEKNGIHPILPTASPVYGACVKCIRLYGKENPEEFDRNFMNTFPSERR